MRLQFFNAVRCLFVLFSIGIFIFIIVYTYQFSVPTTKLFDYGKPLFSQHTEKEFVVENGENGLFDTAVRRLLHTYSMAYENFTKCESGGELNSKDAQLLGNVSRLIPQLRSEMVPYPDGYFKDRGIVLTVGRDQLLHTKFNLRIIEWSKTKLSVELWYSSAQMSDDIINDILNYVPQLKLRTCCFETFRCRSFDGNEITIPTNYVHAPYTKNVNGKKYSFKLGAIVSSTFAEVIFLDSDCYLTRDPTYLFEKDPMYKKFGALFYPDIYMSHQRPQLWSALNATCVQREFSVDSGVLLLDKKRVWNGIYMAKLMGDHPKYFYEYFISHGDKDTFRLAFRHMKIPYYIVSIPCATGYVHKGSFCGVTLCKTDSLGLNIYFDHVHHPKHQSEIFSKENFTHSMVALADPNNQTFYFGYCGLYTLPCFQVGLKDEAAPVGLDTYCKTSALIPSQRPLLQIPGQTILWNPNLETKLILMKRSNETMPGFIDFYFETQKEAIYKNVHL